MVFRPPLVEWVRLCKQVEGIFTFKRAFHLPHKVSVRWLEVDGFLREPFASPMCLRLDTKPGFHGVEFVH